MKNFSLILFLMLNVLNLKAQKLPNEQTVSMRLPPNFKIDGIANEWNNKFQANNKNTNIYATIANNGQALYLALQATNPIIIKKIIGGGITFTICTIGERDDKNPFSITYPVIAKNFQTSMFATFNELSTENNELVKDSLVVAANKKVGLGGKTIKVAGFKTISDTLISIYNNTGIKAAIHINAQGNLTCEFIVPLKLLGLAENVAKLIAYNIMLNSPTALESTSISRKGEVGIATSIPISLARNRNDINMIQYPTDYWGKYTIVK